LSPAGGHVMLRSEAKRLKSRGRCISVVACKVLIIPTQHLAYWYSCWDRRILIEKAKTFRLRGREIFADTNDGLKSTVFWDITLCSPLSVNRRFGGTYRLHVQLSTCVHDGFLLTSTFDPEDGGDMFLWNVGRHSTDYTALYPRRWYSSIDLEILTDLHVLKPPWIRKSGFWNAACLYVCMRNYLALGRLDGFYSYSVSESSIRHKKVPGKHEHPSSKSRGPSDGPLHLEKESNDDYISVIYRDHLPKQNCTGDIFTEIPVRTLGAKTRNIDSVEIWFTAGRSPLLLGIQYRATIDFVSKAM
jgi:hypothetical protein